jgi:PBP1b-binding outer membrane lipoprotein LpoB
MFSRSKISTSLAAGFIAAIIAGCATHDRENVGATRPDTRAVVQANGVASKDITAVADKMARGIMGVPEIANAQKVVRIVLLPVKVDTELSVDRSRFLEPIVARLNERAAGKVRFQARDLSGADSNSQQLKGVDYLLTGKLAGQTTVTSAGTTDYVLYSFELIDLKTTEIVWNGSHRIKKQGQ